MIGSRFGRLVAVSFVERDKHGKQRWLFRCDCGEEIAATLGNVKSGTTRSCGCLQRERTSAAKRTHGESHRTKEYRTWKDMRRRCRVDIRYVGRGIVVCDEWAEFNRFLADMGRAPTPKHSIDRVDNDGPYAPWNCRWATTAQQNRNTRRTIRVGDGCLRDACAAAGANYQTVLCRVRRGVSIQEAIKP